MHERKAGHADSLISVTATATAADAALQRLRAAANASHVQPTSKTADRQLCLFHVATLPRNLSPLGMGYQAYRNLGGVPRDSPDFNPAVVYDPIPQNTMPYLLLVSVLGTFMLTQLRKLMICDWRLPFPSGTASGIMLTSFHTAVSRCRVQGLLQSLGFQSCTAEHSKRHHAHQLPHSELAQ